MLLAPSLILILSPRGFPGTAAIPHSHAEPQSRAPDGRGLLSLRSLRGPRGWAPGGKLLSAPFHALVSPGPPGSPGTTHGLVCGHSREGWLWLQAEKPARSCCSPGNFSAWGSLVSNPHLCVSSAHGLAFLLQKGSDYFCSQCLEAGRRDPQDPSHLSLILDSRVPPNCSSHTDHTLAPSLPCPPPIGESRQSPRRRHVSGAPPPPAWTPGGRPGQSPAAARPQPTPREGGLP